MNGLNIATKAGEGDAFIDDWHNYHSTVNRINQQNMAEMERNRNAFDRSVEHLALQGGKLRPVDIPQYMQYQNDFRNAGVALLDKRLSPETRAALQAKQNEAYINSMSLAKRSADATNFQHEIQKDRFASNGVYRISQEDHEKLMKLYEQTPTDKLSELGLNRYTTYQTPHDDTPKDLEKQLFGSQVIKPTYEPVYDGKRKIGDNVKEYSIYEKTPSQIAAASADILHKSKAQRDRAEREFMELQQTNPEALNALMNKAREIAKQNGGEVAQLHDDPYGYYAAKNILLGQEKKYVGDRGFKIDPIVDREDKQANQRALKEMGLAATRSNIMLREAIKKTSDGGKTKSEDDIQIRDVFKEINDLASAADEGAGAPVNSLSATAQKAVLSLARSLKPKKSTEDPLSYSDIYIKKEKNGSISVKDAKTKEKIATLNYQDANQPVNSGSVKVRSKINAAKPTKSTSKKEDPLGLF